MQWILDIVQLAVAALVLLLFIYVQFFASEDERSRTHHLGRRDETGKTMNFTGSVEIPPSPTTLQPAPPPAASPPRVTSAPAPLSPAAFAETPAVAALYAQTSKASVHTYQERRSQQERRVSGPQPVPVERRSGSRRDKPASISVAACWDSESDSAQLRQRVERESKAFT